MGTLRRAAGGRKLIVRVDRTELSKNIVHGSDSKASARRELALFFPDGLV